MMPRAYFTFVLIVIAAIVPQPAWAQDDTCLHRTLPLSFEVPAGFSTTQIPLADFRGKLQSKPVKILSLLPDDRTHRIVLLVDASSSMERIFPRALFIASLFADNAGPNAQVALLFFGAKIKETIGFTQEQGAVSKRLRQLREDKPAAAKLVQGRTAIYDALLAGLDLLKEPTSADSLYLISDGGESSSKAPASVVLQRLTTSGVRLFAAFPAAALRERATIEEVSGPPEISDLARRSGGEVVHPPEPPRPGDAREGAQFLALLSAFHYNMLHTYRLEVELPERLNRPHSWELEIAGESKKRWKDARLRYPTELAACGP
jgi:hypothetical protein